MMRRSRYLRRGARDTELSQEIAHYIAQETDDNMARGMSAEEARVAAICKFGNRRAVRETVYERNSIGWLEVVTQDLRYGLRQLRRRPGFAAAAIGRYNDVRGKIPPQTFANLDSVLPRLDRITVYVRVSVIPKRSCRCCVKRRAGSIPTS